MKEVEFLDELGEFSRSILPDKVVGIYAMVGRYYKQSFFSEFSLRIHNYPCVRMSVCQFVRVPACLPFYASQFVKNKVDGISDTLYDHHATKVQTAFVFFKSYFQF